MLTLFTTTKSFQGIFGVIQRNAIRSWTLLRPQCDIIIFGDDPGTAQTAADLGVRHVPEVARSPYGTPLVSDIFAKAQELGFHRLLCYVNADILLMDDFMAAVREIAALGRGFLMVGRRLDLDLAEPLDFEPGWQTRLRSRALETGKLHPPTGIDYFVFPRDLWGEFPPFAVGRAAWDNATVFRARGLGAWVVDATQVVMAIHQNHGYSHCLDGVEEMRNGPDAKRNRELRGDHHHAFRISDATHVLTPGGLRRALDWGHVWRHIRTFPVLYPRLGLPLRIVLVPLHAFKTLSRWLYGTIFLRGT